MIFNSLHIKFISPNALAELFISSQMIWDLANYHGHLLSLWLCFDMDIRVFLKGHFVKKKNVHPTT